MSDRYSRQIEIINERGLHARASAKVVELSESFACDAVIRFNGERADPRSLMDLLTLVAAKGSLIDADAEGEDAPEYLDALEALISSRFGEEK
jgi:phosphocarrier protein